MTSPDGGALMTTRMLIRGGRTACPGARPTGYGEE